MVLFTLRMNPLLKVRRLYSTLLLLERNAEGSLAKGNLSLAAVAQKFKDEPIDGIIIGDSPVPQYAFLRKLHVIKKTENGCVAEQLSEAILGLGKYKRIIALHGSYGRGIVPRLAAAWDAACLSDVIELQVDGDVIAKRPIYAGILCADIRKCNHHMQGRTEQTSCNDDSRLCF